MGSSSTKDNKKRIGNARRQSISPAATQSELNTVAVQPHISCPGLFVPLSIQDTIADALTTAMFTNTHRIESSLKGAYRCFCENVLFL